MLYLFWGKVKKGKGRGKKLGFPTTNIALHKNFPEGVYFSKTNINNQWYPSLTFIGAAKTFNETGYQAETYILQSNSLVILGRSVSDDSRIKKVNSGQARMTFNLYGQWITINLLKKLRGSKKFASAYELVKQMKADEKEATKYFARRP